MSNDLFVVNGSHDPEKLQQLLYTFIKKFVLCTKCNNPETGLNVVNQNIKQKCIACGHEYTMPKAIHKLTTYIINHPADGTNGAVNGSTTSKSTKSSKSEKKSKKNGTNGQSQNSPNNPDNENNGNADFVEDKFDDDFDDDELTSDAYHERLRELCNGMQSGMYLSDHKESANIFYKLVKERKEANQLGDANIQKDLLKEAERLGIKDKATIILSELLFSENIIEEIQKYKILLLRFCHENKKAQKYLLGGFEKLVGEVYKDKLFAKIAIILKKFYDEDVLEEEVLIEWSAKESKKYVSKDMSKKIHEKAAPFIKWLKEAEVEEDSESEEDDEPEVKQTEQKQANPQQQQQQRKQSRDENDDDDENEDDIGFSHRVSGIQLQEVKPAVAASKAVNAEVKAAKEEDDIDIDDI